MPPPYTAKLQDETVYFLLDSDEYVSVNDPRLLKLLELTNAMNAAVPLDRLLVEFVELITGGREFSYKITALDGRQWLQTLHVLDDGTTKMTFDVPDLWEKAEFVPGRPIRDQIESILRSTLSVSKIDIKY